MNSNDSSKNLRIKFFNDFRPSIELAVKNVYSSLNYNRESLKESQVKEFMEQLLNISRALRSLDVDIQVKATVNEKFAVGDTCNQLSEG